MNGKPVYCRNCYGKKDGGSGTERFPAKTFNDRAPIQSSYVSLAPVSSANDIFKKELQAINIKLDRLTEALALLTQSSKPAVKKDVVVEAPKKEVTIEAVVKKSVKKATSKK